MPSAKSQSTPRLAHAAPTDRDLSRLYKVVAKWKKVLGLDLHEIQVEILQGERDHTDWELESGGQCVASIQSGWPYSTHSLRIDPTFWDQDAVGREIAVLHELTHLIFGGYDVLLHRSQDGRLVTDDAAHDVAEAAAEWVTRVLLRIVKVM